MPDYPPILNIPVSKSARDLRPIDLTLRFDEPREKEGKFGPQFMYSVEVGGVEHTLFATEALHKRMQEHMPRKGSVLSVARLGEGKETKWDVIYVSGPKDGAGTTSASSGPTSHASGSGGTRPHAPDPDGFTNDLALYWQSFDLAMTTLKAKGVTPQVDANACAFVIYKMAKDHGIEDPSDPGEPQTTAQAEAKGKSKMQEELEVIFRETGLSNTLWMQVLSACSEDGVTVDMWEDLTRDAGLAAFAMAKNVKQGITTWADVLDELGINDVTDEDLPF